MADIVGDFLSDAIRGGDTVATEARDRASEMGNADRVAILLCTNRGLIAHDHAPRHSQDARLKDQLKMSHSTNANQYSSGQLYSELYDVIATSARRPYQTRA